MTVAVRHRHSVEGGYARGEETRARIVTAALKLFGQRGFDGASTRDIATAAAVNAPALQYYFDNKEGVFIACVEHIVKRVWEYLSEVVERAEQAVEAEAGDEELIRAFCDIQLQLAGFMFTSKDAEDWRLFMARLQSGEGPPAGFKIIYQYVSSRMSKVTSTIVGRLLGRPADDEETLIRTMTLSGQLMVFQLARRSVMTKLNWDEVDAQRLALLQKVLLEHTQSLLRSMIATRQADSRHNRDTQARRAPSRRKKH
jgi:TetR/AcrR family transcriptional regulator, regulator of cefoperazone and chloramphenicol sensitivity